MKFVSIVGARPQFVKAAALSRVIRERHVEILVHTGQHYDDGMSEVFFRELGIPAPDHELSVGSGSHGRQTGLMLTRIEPVLEAERPDRVVLFGDTNSTLAGAVAAAKLHLPIAHVEAGLRSFDRRMPEEINRVVADHLSDRLLCPSRTAVENLAREGIVHGVHLVGDVMADVLFEAKNRAAAESGILERLGLRPGAYALATVHRAENTDDPSRLDAIVSALSALPGPVVFPVHPRTRTSLEGSGRKLRPPLLPTEPLGYLDMVRLTSSARIVLTDSGGLQKEAYWLGVPCVTLRDETEWVETVEAGWNVLAGAEKDRIVDAARGLKPPSERPPLYGDGRAAVRCVEVLEAT